MKMSAFTFAFVAQTALCGWILPCTPFQSNARGPVRVRTTMSDPELYPECVGSECVPPEPAELPNGLPADALILEEPDEAR